MAPSIDHPTPSHLPALFLPSIVVLPALQLTFPLPEDIARPLLRLVQQSDYPLVGVFPLSGQSPYEWGCAARVLRVARPASAFSSSKSAFNVTLQGLGRIRLSEPVPTSIADLPPLPEYAVTYPSLDAPPESPTKETVNAFRTAAFRLLDRLDLEPQGTSNSARIRPDVWRRLRSLVQDVSPEGAVWLADIMMGVIEVDWDDKLAFLAVAGVTERLTKATEIFHKRSDISEVSSKISQDVGESLSNQQKEYFLRQQLQAIQKELIRLTKSKSSANSPAKASITDGKKSELDDDQDDTDELADLKKKIEAMTPGSEERKMAAQEWKRLKRIPPGSVENGVIRNYLDWLTALPWPSPSDVADESTSVLLDKAFLSKARAQLDADHYGLDQIKKRLIEHLAVMRLRTVQALQEAELEKAANPDAKASPVKLKGPILLLVGPPGCGKTSIAHSIASALQRPFQRISLGGVRDEAEIRGHRRTYVASGPGSIVQALRRSGRRDMLLLLDEIDKVGQNNFHGDPSAALLEVLDPEQNHTFHDHYINVPVDLSQVLMVATANTLDTISPPLLDRCEVIHLSGYTYDEKMHIAKSFLLPKQLKSNGLPSEQIEITDGALQYIASRYTREAGVRTLERQISSVVRHKAVEWADSQEASTSGPSIVYEKLVDESSVADILGLEWWNPEERDKVGKRGVVNGLVVQGAGEGGILPVETLLVPGTGRLRLTGSLGDVIKESGEIALSWVKANAYNLGLTSSPAEDPLLVPESIDIHLHLPSGAQKKDGPSAGLAMICAFVSLLTGAVVPSNVAMTGEVTLRGHVTPIGGVKEKILGAHRASVRKVILPKRNAREYEFEFSKHPLREEMEVVFVSTIREGLEAAFGAGVLRWREDRAFVAESRL